jgi:hypothetical protein
MQTNLSGLKNLPLCPFPREGPCVEVGRYMRGAVRLRVRQRTARAVPAAVYGPVIASRIAVSSPVRTSLQWSMRCNCVAHSGLKPYARAVAAVIGPAFGGAQRYRVFGRDPKCGHLWVEVRAPACRFFEIPIQMNLSGLKNLPLCPFPREGPCVEVGGYMRGAVRLRSQSAWQHSTLSALLLRRSQWSLAL